MVNSKLVPLRRAHEHFSAKIGPAAPLGTPRGFLEALLAVLPVVHEDQPLPSEIGTVVPYDRLGFMAELLDHLDQHHFAAVWSVLLVHGSDLTAKLSGPEGHFVITEYDQTLPSQVADRLDRFMVVLNTTEAFA